MFEDELIELIDEITVHERFIRKQIDKSLDLEDDAATMYLAMAADNLTGAVSALEKLYSLDYIYDSSLSQ